jgi:hypothetical protein
MQKMGLRADEPPVGPSCRSERRSWLPLGLAAALCVVTIGVYAPVVQHEFVLWDDPDYVLENATVLQGLRFDGIARAFSSTHAANWHPLTWMSHMLDVELFGTNPAGHHATNLLLHLFNTLLLWTCFARTTGRTCLSAVVAGLFALHPLHVESVAWVAERKDLLSTLFWLLTILAWVGYSRSGGPLRYLAALLLAACALMAKPMAITLPLTLLLFEYWPLGRLRIGPRGGNLGRLVMEKLPFFCLSAASAAITLWAQRSAGAMAAADMVPLPLRLANASVAYGIYLWKATWPSGLAALYPHPNLVGGTPLAAWQVVASLLVLVAATVVALRAGRAYLGTGWLWYLITLIPVIGIVQVGEQGWADRYTYVPLIGIFAAVAWGGAEVGERVMGDQRWRRVLQIALAVTVLGGCACASRVQLAYWRDTESLFTRAISVGSETSTIHDNLGTALADQGRLDEAIRPHLRAIELAPSSWRAHYNLGNALQRLGRWELAVHHYRQALLLEPREATIHHNLGSALHRLGRVEEAARHYREARRISANKND